MKLLGIAPLEHDSNMAYFDGNIVRYFKSERYYQSKHHAYSNTFDWRKDFELRFEESCNNIDEIAFVGPCTTLDKCDNAFKVDHHIAHVRSSWMLENRKPDLYFSIDGSGDNNNSWIVVKDDIIVERGNKITHGSLGDLFGDAGVMLNILPFNKNKLSIKNRLLLAQKKYYNLPGFLDIPGKLMGLLAYGKIDTGYFSFLSKYSLYELNKIFDINLWKEYKGTSWDSQDSKLSWIRTISEYIPDILITHILKFASKNDTIVYSGGVAQNVIWNTKLKNYFKNLIIPPHCGDEGLSLGALEILRQKNKLPAFCINNFPYIQTDETTEIPSSKTIVETAKLLANNKTVGWYQGNGEVGPRALGNRSILMNPKIPNGKDIINRIKNREYYRPFGASVLEEFKDLYFNMPFLNPFMLYVGYAKTNDFPSITHKDNSCRLQTVANDNSAFRGLLEAFYKITNIPVLLNTSLNVAGKPIAAFQSDALKVLNTSELDYLVIGDNIIKKS